MPHPQSFVWPSLNVKVIKLCQQVWVNCRCLSVTGECPWPLGSCVCFGECVWGIRGLLLYVGGCAHIYTCVCVCVVYINVCVFFKCSVNVHTLTVHTIRARCRTCMVQSKMKMLSLLLKNY